MPLSAIGRTAFSVAATFLFIPNAGAQQDQPLDLADWEVRSLPMAGFFPVGGSLPPTAAFSGFALGPALDFFNLKYASGKVTMLNASAFVIGVNYRALSDETSKLSLLDWGYFRIGPHADKRIVKSRNLHFGTEFGWAMLARADRPHGTTEYLHGLDVSATFTWTEDEPPATSSSASLGHIERDALLVLAGTALAVAGAFTAASGGETCRESADTRTNCYPGPAFTIGLVLAGLGAVPLVWGAWELVAK